jgi:hypothetical protein
MKLMRWALNGVIAMSKFTALLGFLFLVVSSAWAQIPAPSPAPGSPPAGDAGAGGEALRITGGSLRSRS